MRHWRLWLVLACAVVVQAWPGLATLTGYLVAAVAVLAALTWLAMRLWGPPPERPEPYRPPIR